VARSLDYGCPRCVVSITLTGCASLSTHPVYIMEPCDYSVPPASQKSSCSWKKSVKLMMVAYIRRPPKTDMAAAPPAICAECQRRAGRAVACQLCDILMRLWLSCAQRIPVSEAPWSDLPIPMTTKNPVRNLPRSTTPFPWLSIKSSWFAALPHSQFGNGAITYVATTRSVR
jgi:hypothetical protein